MSSALAQNQVPPPCNTGVLITHNRLQPHEQPLTVHVDYLRGTTSLPLDTVLWALASTLPDSEVTVLDRAFFGYARAYDMSGVTIMDNPDRPEMGVCIDISGSTCQELGYSILNTLYWTADLKATRVDLALDYCPFTPATLEKHWKNGQVRTRVQVDKRARADRQYRRCEWQSSATGDTFYMGSRKSQRFARCYDLHGFTRFELETKAQYASTLADHIFTQEQTGLELAQTALSAIRAFVDFVEPSENGQNDKPLPFWGAFIQACEKLVLHLPRKASKTIDEVVHHVKMQYGATLAMIRKAYGSWALFEIATENEHRMKAKHRRMLKDHKRERLRTIMYGGSTGPAREWTLFTCAG
jgi:DNA relaxase NicK